MHGQSITLRNHDGTTPLHTAAYNRKHDVVELLLNHSKENDRQGTLQDILHNHHGKLDALHWAMQGIHDVIYQRQRLLTASLQGKADITCHLKCIELFMEYYKCHDANLEGMIQQLEGIWRE